MDMSKSQAFADLPRFCDENMNLPGEPEFLTQAMPSRFFQCWCEWPLADASLVIQLLPGEDDTVYATISQFKHLEREYVLSAIWKTWSPGEPPFWKFRGMFTD